MEKKKRNREQELTFDVHVVISDSKFSANLFGKCNKIVCAWASETEWQNVESVCVCICARVFSFKCDVIELKYIASFYHSFAFLLVLFVSLSEVFYSQVIHDNNLFAFRAILLISFRFLFYFICVNSFYLAYIYRTLRTVPIKTFILTFFITCSSEGDRHLQLQ